MYLSSRLRSASSYYCIPLKSFMFTYVISLSSRHTWIVDLNLLWLFLKLLCGALGGPLAGGLDGALGGSSPLLGFSAAAFYYSCNCSCSFCSYSWRFYTSCLWELILSVFSCSNALILSAFSISILRNFSSISC